MSEKPSKQAKSGPVKPETPRTDVAMEHHRDESTISRLIALCRQLEAELNEANAKLSGDWPKKPCEHKLPSLYTTFNVSKDQYEWHCTKCGEVVQTKTALCVELGK